MENTSIKSSKNYLDNFIIIVCLLVSISEIISWLTEFKVLSFIRNYNPMKFYTAIVIFFAGINLFLFHKTAKISSTIYTFLSILIILIGLITFSQFLGFYIFEIDSFLKTDNFALENPIRMSPASAICAISLGIGFISIKTKNSFCNSLGKDLILFAALISLIVIISYALLIPKENMSVIFNTMSIQTSLLFFIISILLMFKKTTSLFNKMFYGKYLGSIVFQKVFPLFLIFPIVLANGLLLGINQNWINIDMGIVIYTVILIPFLIIYFSRIALTLNTTDEERQKLEEDLVFENMNLTHFNKALDVVTIIGITDANGIITYVNDSFCEISKFTKEELIGKTHKIIKSDYHDNEFFKTMWLKIKAGEVWVGEIKNTAKDGSYYWVDTTIIPFKNKENVITGFMSIRQVITERKEKELLMNNK